MPVVITRRRSGGRLLVFVAVGLLIVASLPAVRAAKAPFLTSRPSMLTPVMSGVTASPIISVGDKVGGYRYEAVPDGISVQAPSRGAVSAFVNHETSLVPFPYVPAGPTTANSQNDFDNAQVSELSLSTSNGGVISGKYVIKSSANYQRFCSNYLATAAEGFDQEILFTNEEAIDWVNKEGLAWPATEGARGARQIGAVVAYKPADGGSKAIWGMGRHNHENQVAIPGYGMPVLLSGDDAFVSNPAQSQVYMYAADDAQAVWKDEGELWAFVADNYATYNDYYDFPIGSASSISGHFVQVPKEIATGRNPDGTDMMSFDVPVSLGGPYLAPPNNGSWQRQPTGTGIGIDGPQWVLEKWSDLHNVFQFVRIEDIAYDKRPGMSNVVYLADSGRGLAGSGATGTGDFFTPFTSSNGRIWKMVLDPTDPTVVTSLSILIEGDDNVVKTLGEIHQPDNLETTPNGLYITEDPGSSQQFAYNDTSGSATTARLWQYALPGGALNVVVSVNQAASDELAGYDVDPSSTPGNKGAWESTGIVDVSAIFGAGTFLINVQASTLFVEIADGPDLVAPAGPDWLYKRAGGQLLLLTIPGG